MNTDTKQLIYCKNFYRCHNVHPLSTIIKINALQKIFNKIFADKIQPTEIYPRFSSSKFENQLL
jgi:hypothetical protein